MWLGAVGFVGSKHIVESPTLNTSLWAASVVVIPIAFLILELYNKRSQRKFLWRTRKIYHFINNRNFSELNDIDDFRFYDPAGENWRKELDEEEYRAFENFISPTELIKNPNVFVALYLPYILFDLSCRLSLGGFYTPILKRVVCN